MSDRKRPVSLSKMAGANCWPWHGRLSFRLRWGQAEGPAPVTDGRPLVAMMEDHELADVLAQVPAGALNPGSYMALMRTIDLLRAEPSRFAGVRADDLAAVLPRVEHQLTLTPDERTACKRLRDAAGLPGPDPDACQPCGGTGKIVQLYPDSAPEPWRPGSYAPGVVRPCETCHGTGKAPETAAATTNGDTPDA